MTAMMARAADRFQLSAMRANFAQKCGLPAFAAFEVCSPENQAYSLERLKANLDLVTDWHHVRARIIMGAGVGWGGGGDDTTHTPGRTSTP